MKHAFSPLFAAVLALGLSAAPVLSSAAAVAPGMSYYTTKFVQVYGSPAPYLGTLQLQISPDNIVSGYYRPDNQSFIPVTGGRDGKDIWFDIGGSGQARVTARLEGHSIVGSAVDGGVQYTFTATRTPSFLTSFHRAPGGARHGI